ncbi:SDR family oxidoreductase [Methylobacterium terricola]|uniref:SDR family oxidoreductase n=1 Tax=Methylobacterium terricola TaxID=2583531 RepID=A0A5C4LIM3_9HYPH|nr:SDR family oxidoreductase [Methylobacterium terricola]TNC13395.1 SDR family oxidoreductase [Methylobacterium terricola]
MRILVLGGYGLIGAAVLAQLLDAGHDVLALGRDTDAAQRLWPEATWIAHDIATLSEPAAWHPVITGCDAVVNCAGVLQDGPRDDVRAVQDVAMRALFRACAATGLRRIVQISAVGASPEARTAFMRSKAAADAALSRLDLDWTILRPGLVLAPTAYGGTALLRALASAPLVLPVVGGAGPIQTVHVDDVAEAVRLAVEGRVPTRAAYDLVEDETHPLSEVVAAFRAWLGHPPARVVTVPRLLVRPVVAVSDGLGRLGWRSPLRSTALAQVTAGVTGDPGPWRRAGGPALSGLRASLRRLPSTVQERWFGRLWLLKPAVIGGLALFWLVSGLVGLARFDAAASVLTGRGVGPDAAHLAVAAGIGLDLTLGAAMLVRRLMPFAALAMIGGTLAYLAAGTWLAPDLWADPLGPFVKTLPAALLALAALALAAER